MQAQQGQKKTSEALLSSADNNRDIGTWQNPEGAWGTNLSSPASSTNDIIVDTHDKEAWPSIGDQSEAASSSSDTGDTVAVGASVKTSSSVISSSSNPEQTQVDHALPQSSSGVGVVGHSDVVVSSNSSSGTSSVWGASSFLSSSVSSNRSSSSEKLDSGAWGSTSGSAGQINSSPSVSGWGESSSPPGSASVSSNSNQGLMQSGQSATNSGSDSDLNTVHNRIPGSGGATAATTTSWGLNSSSAAVGNNNNGQVDNTMSRQEHGVSSSGASAVNNGPTDSQSASNNAMSWQGINFSSAGLPGLQKDQAANSASAWGNISAGNSVIGSGLGISSTAGSYSMDNSNKMDQWGSSQSSGSNSLGWNTTPSSASQPEPSGWGSPCPSPNPGAGTEAWGAPDKNTPPQAWGQPNSKANSGTPPVGGWSQTNAKTAPSSTGWGDPAEAPSQPSGGWGQPPPKQSPSPWGQQSQSAGQAQWGSGGAANPPATQTSSSGWGSGAAGASVPPTGGPSPWGGSGGGNGGGVAGSGANAPVGSKPPPTPNPQSQPTSWAQAAGRGLYAQQPNKPPTPTSLNPAPPQTPADPKEQFISQVVNSHDGWGKRPVRQDTSWDMEESPKMRRRNSNTEVENPSSHWDNSKGTQIWESSKGNMAPPPPPQWDSGGNRGAAGGGGGGGDWGRDNDSGHWNGPPGPGDSSNQWNGPNGPHSSNQWGGGSGGSNWGGGDRRDGSGDRASGRGGDSSHWGGSSSSNSWDSNKSDNSHWGGGKEDNVWDRNGTNAWGSNKVERGMWGGCDRPPRRGSSSSWGDDNIEPMGWEDPDHHHHGGGMGAHQRQNSAGSVDDGTSFWGEPNPSHRGPPNWNNQPNAGGMGPPRGPPPDDKMGMWGGHPNNKPPPNSWGDQKLDDSPFWGQNQPPQNKGWNDNQWGGVKPKTPSWGEPPDWNQQGRRMGDSQQLGGGAAAAAATAGGGWGCGEDTSVLDDDLGNWEGSQDSTSSWTGVQRDCWSKTQMRRTKGPPFMPNNGRQPQMRAKLLLQLTEMGFKREDAQTALINNNMNLDSAIADLVQTSKSRGGLDFDMDGKRKIQGIQPDGLGPDAQPDIGQFTVPPSGSNTPFPGNAQSQLASSQVINPLNKGVPSLQNPSSLSGLGQSSSISPSLQQKILAHQLAQQQQMGRGGGVAGMGAPQGQAIRGQMTAQSMQQHLMQQTVQQLRMAVQAGLISPQLLNQQLTPNLRVMLHQLLQFQETHKQLIQQQQLLQQHLAAQKPQNPMMATQLERQLEQVTLTVQHIQKQTARLQQQMAEAQTALPKQVSGGGDTGIKVDLLKDLTSNMSGLQINSKDHFPQLQQQQSQGPPPQQQQPPVQPQTGTSRLTQWKLPSPDKESAATPASSAADVNKAPGSKPLSAAHSAPNLQNKLETPASAAASSGLPFSDNTWSTLGSTSTATSSWPSTSAIATTPSTTATSMAPSLDGDDVISSSSQSKESPGGASDTADVAATSSSSGELSITPSVSTATPTSTSPGGTPTNQAGININDMIEEFVPGKRWQGITIKSVEDDPFITPGSIQRPSLSVNTIKDDYVMTTLGKSTSPTSSESALGSGGWGSGGLGSLGKTAVVGAGTRSSWSSTSLTEPSLGSELWGIPQAAKNTRPPPGLTGQKPPGSGGGSAWQSGSGGGGTGGFNRSVSWAPGDRSFSAMGNAWSGDQLAPSNCLLLKNLTPQIDGSTLRTLCQQHGPLQAFYLNLGYGQAIVRYGAKDEAAKAQMSLNSCVLGNTTIVAEFVTDADANRVLEQLNSQGGGAGGAGSLMRSASEAPGSGGGAGTPESKDGGGGGQWGSVGSGTAWSSGGGASSLWSAGADASPGGGSLDSDQNTLLPGGLLSGQSM